MGSEMEQCQKAAGFCIKKFRSLHLKSGVLRGELRVVRMVSCAVISLQTNTAA